MQTYCNELPVYAFSYLAQLLYHLLGDEDVCSTYAMTLTGMTMNTMAKTMSVVASYSGLYEEGDVEHINCVWPVSATQQLI